MRVYHQNYKLIKWFQFSRQFLQKIEVQLSQETNQIVSNLINSKKNRQIFKKKMLLVYQFSSLFISNEKWKSIINTRNMKYRFLPQCLLVLLCFLTSINTQAGFLDGFPMGQVHLIGDNGKFLARCYNCGSSDNLDSAGVHSVDGSLPWTIWRVRAVGNKIALQSDNGKYLSRCYGCWKNSKNLNSAFIHIDVPEDNPWALWKPERLSNGKWALKADNGNYLARCFRCVQDSSTDDFAFVHLSSLIGQPWAEWTVQTLFPTGYINIQNLVTRKYLAACTACADSPYFNSAGVHQNDPDKQDTIWIAKRVAHKIVLKNQYAGNYLARCYNCWNDAKYLDSAFIQDKTYENNPEAQWTPEFISTAFWNLKSDIGRYLSSCNKCVSNTAVDQFAFVHIEDGRNTLRAQWKVTKRFPAGKINLLADNGRYLARCYLCGQSTIPDSPGVHVTDPKLPWAIWTAQWRNNKIALKADNGKYLSSCYRVCWGQATYYDSAALKYDNPFGHDQAYWEPVSLNNGKWALKGANGKYLARCNRCVTDSTLNDFAFVHVDDPEINPLAQWHVESH